MRLLYSLIVVILTVLPVSAGQTLSFGFINAPLSASSLAVLKAAYAKLDIQVEGVPLPPARSLTESNAGRTDGEVHRIKAIAQDLPNLIRIDVPVNHVESLAITCNTSLKNPSIDTIRDLRIGIKIGTRYAEKMTQDMPKVVRKTHEDKLMQLLRANRLDIVIGDRPWAQSLKREKSNACVRINEPPLVVIPLFHYLHKRHAALVPKITRILRRMHENGESNAIRAQVITSLTTTP